MMTCIMFDEEEETAVLLRLPCISAANMSSDTICEGPNNDGGASAEYIPWASPCACASRPEGSVGKVRSRTTGRW